MTEHLIALNSILFGCKTCNFPLTFWSSYHLCFDKNIFLLGIVLCWSNKQDSLCCTHLIAYRHREQNALHWYCHYCCPAPPVTPRTQTHADWKTQTTHDCPHNFKSKKELLKPVNLPLAQEQCELKRAAESAACVRLCVFRLICVCRIWIFLSKACMLALQIKFKVSLYISGKHELLYCYADWLKWRDEKNRFHYRTYFKSLFKYKKTHHHFWKALVCEMSHTKKTLNDILNYVHVECKEMIEKTYVAKWKQQT